MSKIKFRSGTSQEDKLLKALQPGRVSVEERSITDMLRYVKEYAKSVRFYDENNAWAGFWTSFIDFDIKERDINLLEQYLENPGLVSFDEVKFSPYSKPHISLLIAFLKLLDYPKKKFALLTEKNMDYFYREVLRLKEKAEVPDQVHVTVHLANDVKEHLLKKDVLLSAGKDNTGVDIRFAVGEDIVLNQAQISDIKTIHFNKTTASLKYIHLENNRGDAGFEKMLCAVLGNLSSLPAYDTGQNTQIDVDGKYLRTQLYNRIKGKEKDELQTSDIRYISGALCFRYLKDFVYCLDLYYRENNRGYTGITLPEEEEWEKAYLILEDVHKERLARERRLVLKDIHKNQGFESMMEFAFGEPGPGDMLYRMPESVTSLEGLYNARNEASSKYIEIQLCMTVDEFKVVMEKKDNCLTTISGDEVYTILETAWTKKRGYVYPVIGSDIIEGYYADLIYSQEAGDKIGRFSPFAGCIAKESRAEMTLGFAVSSVLFQLNEGVRQIDIVISCASLPDKIIPLLTQNLDIFKVYLTTKSGWLKAGHVDFSAGKFILKSPLKSYERENCSLICDIKNFPLFETNTAKYIVFNNSTVYRIIEKDFHSWRIYLRSLSLRYPVSKNRLIKKLIPRDFVSELKDELDVDESALEITSSIELFDEYTCGKYLVDKKGAIFLIKKFISTKKILAGYCGNIMAINENRINEDDRLFVNKIWEEIEPQYDELDSDDNIDLLAITGIYSAMRNYQFHVTDKQLKIMYPQESTAAQLTAAWETWKDNPLNDPKRFQIAKRNSGAGIISDVVKNIERTGEIIKRYESIEQRGIRITYRGRLIDPAALVIQSAAGNSLSSFMISGSTLTITPGANSRTANQIAADWQNSPLNRGYTPGSFSIESKDNHEWEAVPVDQVDLNLVDKQIKKCELTNSFGVGIRVWYTGETAHQPRFILQENTIDIFEFEIINKQVLTVKYPSITASSSFDLIAAWESWKSSMVDLDGEPVNFDIQQMGDGLWTIAAKTEKELTASENQTIECEIPDAGIVVLYRLTAGYENACLEFIKDTNSSIFRFVFSDDIDRKTKILTVYYPPLLQDSNGVIPLEYKHRQLQQFLLTWNRFLIKNEFFIMQSKDDALWELNSDTSVTFNFKDELNYVCTIHSDGMRVKYHKPKELDPALYFTKIPGAKVVIEENIDEHFAFDIFNDYFNNHKVLTIKYPTVRKERTIANLITEWEKALQDKSFASSAGKFKIAVSGTGKWEIAAETAADFIAEQENREITDPVNRKFFEYKTKDVYGFTIHYSGPGTIAPKVTIAENQADVFDISIKTVHDPYFNIDIEESILIKYPARSDRRRMVELFKVWNQYKINNKLDPSIGFEISDSSLVIGKRDYAPLLATGDAVREYNAGGSEGICVTYTGYRDDVELVLSHIEDFTDKDTGKKMLWENGEIFLVTGKEDDHHAAAQYEGNIELYDNVALYEKDAITLQALKFSILLDHDFPPVVTQDAQNLGPFPAVKILLNNDAAFEQTSNFARLYEAFKSICVKRVDIKAAVLGLKNIRMRGDISVINPANPFMPFGITPAIPSSFYFANEEICAKKLDALKININWAPNELSSEDGIPDLEKHYHGYSHCGFEKAGTIKNYDFEVSLKFLDQRSWVNISEETQVLAAKALEYYDFNNQTLRGPLFSEGEEIPRDPFSWPRYYKLQLANQDSMQELYLKLTDEKARAKTAVALAESEYNAVKQEIKAREALARASKIAAAEADEKKAAYFQPAMADARKLPLIPPNDKDINALTINPPYSFLMQSVSIDYSASSYIILDPVSLNCASDDQYNKLFRFNPFGMQELGTPGDTDNFLLPQYDNEGSLFIGIKNLEPLQTLSLLVQMIPGSGDPNLTFPQVKWSYLSHNKWLPFSESAVLKDTTFGLQDTGIIRFAMPGSVTSSNTVMPGNRSWICAQVSSNANAVSDIMDIRTQSICASYVNKNNDPDRPGIPLAAGTIKELVIRDPAVKEVIQPYTSFNGISQEKRASFYGRVSEMLKHRNRALAPADYEKLILDRFPQVYKVKCMPQSELDLLDSADKGEVVIIVIYKNSNSTPFFPLKPQAPLHILEEIKRFIKAYMPPLVSVKVKNPRFEEIKYRLAIKFAKGYEEGFFINRLNEDIKQFLSPWAYNKDAAITFGNSVYSSSVINMVENSGYVDYVANFSLLQQTIVHETYTEVIPLFLTEDNAAEVKYPDSILVSADHHIIDVIRTDFYDAAALCGIGYMKIGSDFWITRPGPIFSVGISEMEIEQRPIPRYAFSGLTALVRIRGAANGIEVVKEINTALCREDSQQIYNLLKSSGYLDNDGNVLSTYDLFAEDFVFMLSQTESFDTYVKNHLHEFLFTLEIEASDFDPAAGDEDEFSYVVEEIHNLTDIESDIIMILKTGLAFDMVSQYPFIIY